MGTVVSCEVEGRICNGRGNSGEEEGVSIILGEIWGGRCAKSGNLCWEEGRKFVLRGAVWGGNLCWEQEDLD